MISPSKQDSRLPWLGGEAHVRRQEERPWRIPAEWQQGLWVFGALLLGSAIGGGVAASIRPSSRSQRYSPTQQDMQAPATYRLRPRRKPIGLAPLAIAFAAGSAVGAGMGLMSAPCSGPDLRRRIALGVKTAQDELTEAVEDTREAVGALGKDARQTLRQTAMRMTEVVTATKAALTSEGESIGKEPAR